MDVSWNSISRKTVNITSMWKLSNKIFNNQWVQEETNLEIRKYLETNENTTTHHNFGIQHKQDLYYDHLHFQNRKVPSNSPEKEEPTKSYTCRRKKIINIRVDIIEIENDKTQVKETKTIF